MSGFDADPILGLDELLDPIRLAAAWQVARERAPAASAVSAPAPGAVEPADAGGAATASPDGDASAPRAVEAAAAPGLTAARPAPLPVALAYGQLVDELARTLRASGDEAKGRLVLAAPLARLTAAIDPLDAGAAEAVIDDLEDLVQALLSDAGWPATERSSAT